MIEKIQAQIDRTEKALKDCEKRKDYNQANFYQGKIEGLKIALNAIRP